MLADGTCVCDWREKNDYLIEFSVVLFLLSIRRRHGRRFRRVGLNLKHALCLLPFSLDLQAMCRCSPLSTTLDRARVRARISLDIRMSMLAQNWKVQSIDCRLHWTLLPAAAAALPCKTILVQHLNDDKEKNVPLNKCRRKFIFIQFFMVNVEQGTGPSTRCTGLHQHGLVELRRCGRLSRKLFLLYCIIIHDTWSQGIIRPQDSFPVSTRSSPHSIALAARNSFGVSWLRLRLWLAYFVHQMRSNYLRIYNILAISQYL